MGGILGVTGASFLGPTSQLGSPRDWFRQKEVDIVRQAGLANGAYSVLTRADMITSNYYTTPAAAGWTTTRISGSGVVRRVATNAGAGAGIHIGTGSGEETFDLDSIAAVVTRARLDGAPDATTGWLAAVIQDTSGALRYFIGAAGSVSTANWVFGTRASGSVFVVTDSLIPVDTDFHDWYVLLDPANPTQAQFRIDDNPWVTRTGLANFSASPGFMESAHFPISATDDAWEVDKMMAIAAQ